MTAPANAPSSPTRTRAEMESIDLVALVLAVVVAPVGLVLGVIGVRRARTRGQAPSVPALLAVLLGAVSTVLAVGAIVLALALIRAAEDQVRADGFCDRFAAYPSPATDIQSLRSDLDATNNTQALVIGPQHTGPQLEEAIARVAEIESQVGGVAGNVGSGYVGQFTEWWNLEEELEEVTQLLNAHLGGSPSALDDYLSQLGSAENKAEEVSESALAFCEAR